MTIRFNKRQRRKIRKFLASFHCKEHTDLYDVFRAIAYLVYTGCQWKMLPTYYPRPTAVYYHFRRWGESNNVMDKLSYPHIMQKYNNQPLNGQSQVARPIVGAFLRPFRSRWNPIAPSKAKESSAKPLWTDGNKKCPKNPSTIDRPAFNLYCRTGS